METAVIDVIVIREFCGTGAVVSKLIECLMLNVRRDQILAFTGIQLTERIELAFHLGVSINDGLVGGFCRLNVAFRA